MSQGTPRKFSEKIAILERKQNEEQEQFHNVMRDVRAITSHKTGPASPTTYAPCSSSSGSIAMHEPSSMASNNNAVMAGSSVCSPSTLSAGPTHPLAMAWNRPGGSLPNVHQMIQQQPSTGDYSAWNYWQAMSAGDNNAQGNHVRTRSPGSHYHPYMNRNQRNPNNERIPPLHGSPLEGGNMMSPSVHLQPPDPSWSKARSDPTIHMNAIAAVSAAPCNAYGYQPTVGGQWIPDLTYRNMNGGGACSPGSAPTSAHSTNFVPTYPTAMQFALNVQQFSPGGPQQQQQMMQPTSMSNCHPQLQQHQSLGSPGQQQMTTNGSGQDISVGSLPNMPSNLLQQQQQHQHQQQQQQQQQYSGTGSSPQTSPPHHQQSMAHHHYQMGGGPHSCGPLTSTTNFRLSTPGGDCNMTASQSAPTSPADQRMEKDALLRGQQWTPTQQRHYSASPDTLDMNSIPNIVLTGADGTLDCFQDLQDLHLDNEIQQLLSNPSEGQVDPALETQLLN